MTPERLAQAGDNNSTLVPAEIEQAGERVVLTRRFADTAIDRMRNAGHLTYAQWFAADWYRSTYENAGLSSRVVSGYGEPTRSGESSYGMPRSHTQAVARQSLREARAAIPSQMLGLLDALVVHDSMPLLKGGAQRQRFTARIAVILQGLAMWLSAPGA